MNYKVFFTTGESIVISDEEFSMFQLHIVQTKSEGVIWVQDGSSERLILINFKNVTHVLPEEESASGVVSTPTPDDLREGKKKKEDAIKSDPDAIIRRTQEKYDENKDS